MTSRHSFIPIDRRFALARGETLPDRTSGTTLFADISGFTPLTETMLKELGRQRGAEELNRQLNLVYTALIAQLHQYQGSVIGFAGDAITCWLDGDDGHRAVACALAMQRAMEPFTAVTTPTGTTIPLAIKIGIAGGAARRFVVGDPDVQFNDVLAGAVLDQVAKAEQLAQQNETIITAQLAEHLGDDIEIAEWREDAGDRFAIVKQLAAAVPPTPWPDFSIESGDEVEESAWMLDPIYQKLQSGDAFLAELRPTVIIFQRFSGLDYAEDAAGEKLDAYIQWVQHTLARYEGTLLQLTIGDKGSYLYAVFGAPIAHSDDPVRAVAAALELRSPPPALAYIQGIQTGISQGLVYTGAYGSNARQTYGVLGNEVNMAARFMGVAQPGQVIVHNRVADAARQIHQFQSIGKVKVKGAAQPIELYEAVGKRSDQLLQRAGLFDTPLVGRESTLAKIHRRLDDAADGTGQILRLQGAMGSGKSHLTTVFGRQAAAKGWHVAVGACLSITQNTPYVPWRQIFRTWIDLDGSDQPETLIPQLENILEGMNPDWLFRLPLLGDLLDISIPDNPTTAAFEPKQRQESLTALALDMLQAWSQPHPLLLIIEDAHWMDESSANLATAVGRAISQLPVMLILVQRDEANAVAPKTEALPHFHSLTIAELSSQAIAQLLSNHLSGPLTAVALALIQAKTEGNPFYTKELADTLRDSEILYQREDSSWDFSAKIYQDLRSANCIIRQDRDWVLADNAPLNSIDLGVPDSIQGVVLARIDRLPEKEKLSLKVSSVIGQRFALDLLNLSHPQHPDPETLRQQTENMSDHDFIILEQLDPAPTYLFRHQATQGVAYETLLFVQRQQLHRAVAAALRQIRPRAIEELAHHAYIGQDWPNALHYQLVVGEHAQQLFANYQAIEHYKKALESAGHLPEDETSQQRQSIHAALGELLTATGQYDPAREHLDQAIALAIRAGDDSGHGRACRWMARSYELQGEYIPSLEWIQKGLIALKSAETAETAELLLLAGLINTRQGEFDNALSLCQSGLHIAEKTGQSSVLARAYSLLGTIIRARGNSSGAIENFQRTLDLYIKAENISGQALAQNQLATAYFDIGQWTKADHYYRQARTIFSQMGDAYNQLMTNNNLGGIANNQGRLDEAIAFYQSAVRAVEQIGGSLWAMGTLSMNLGSAYLRRGDLDTAKEQFDTSRAYYQQAQARDFLPELNRLCAERALASGDLNEAQAKGQHALSLSQELKVRSEEGCSLNLLGDTALQMGRLDQAERYLVDSLAILKEVGDEYQWARSQLTFARLLDKQGKPNETLEAVAAAIAIFEQLDAALELESALALKDSLD